MTEIRGATVLPAKRTPVTLPTADGLRLEAYQKDRPVKMDGVLTPDTELLEYVCAENERDRPHLVGK